jgi:uncharacterized membrane protein (UPF0127 family)
MLFIFEKEAKHGIWMPDMYFSIDIVWLDKNKKVVSTASSVTPETYPKVFVPNDNALYVLELKDGTVENKKIKVGDYIGFNI